MLIHGPLRQSTPWIKKPMPVNLESLSSVMPSAVDITSTAARSQVTAHEVEKTTRLQWLRRRFIDIHRKTNDNQSDHNKLTTKSAPGVTSHMNNNSTLITNRGTLNMNPKYYRNQHSQLQETFNGEKTQRVDEYCKWMWWLKSDEWQSAMQSWKYIRTIWHRHGTHTISLNTDEHTNLIYIEKHFKHKLPVFNQIFVTNRTINLQTLHNIFYDNCPK